VSAAFGTHDFGARHAIGAVCFGYNSGLIQGFVKARILIGLDENANWMDTTTYNGVKSNAARDSFRDRVYMNDYPNNTNMAERNAFMHFRCWWLH
jgi:hypothetical protein